MKTLYVNMKFIVILLAIMMVSCQSMNNLTMSVTEPAPVYIPSTIENIGLLNRSLASTKNKPLDDIDKILSIEGKNLDSDGANYTLQGIKDVLEKDMQYKSIKMMSSDKIENPGMGIFPSALPWGTINNLCQENDLNAIITLSFYDTDTQVAYKTRTVEKLNAFGITIPMIEHEATISTYIKAGFRVYDNVNKVIRDEIVTDRWITAVGKGINPLKAIEAIIGRKEALLQMSTKMGQDYAYRTYPFKIRVTRQYYVKGSKKFEIGKRRAQTGDWDGAAQLWEQELNNPKAKIAGYACYNMAIINEINGDLDSAMTWASKAYTDYEDKNALRYLNILKKRKNRNIQLQKQAQ
ncbi:hypothetical protein BZARG_1379 [Bizionia argentinensis JUB59]|uniref:Tetratricopeptide repeat protein n=1 Tax=Bizionia argentinensis JUB59 TaxID=1046627 RepID=G2EDM8_9FLAO|nr:DUF6340 family protein [Bizionia argentinensis]EGV43470.1 hypothetical protein BZARG_1379 [Bizionia argentinensis JUB59]